MDVAVIGEDNARLQGDYVIAIVPLLTLLFEMIAAGADDMQTVDVQGFLNDIKDVTGIFDHLERVSFIWVERKASDLVRHLREAGDNFAVTERQYRIEMHSGPGCWHLTCDDALRHALLEQRNGQLPTASGVVRSPMPTSTQPFPIGITSPPSSVAGPKS